MPCWWGQSDLHAQTPQWKADVRVGASGRATASAPTGTTFHLEGEYLEVDPPRLVHTLIHASGTAVPLNCCPLGNLSRKAFTACTRVVLSYRHRHVVTNPSRRFRRQYRRRCRSPRRLEAGNGMARCLHRERRNHRHLRLPDQSPDDNAGIPAISHRCPHCRALGFLTAGIVAACSLHLRRELPPPLTPPYTHSKSR